MRRRLVHLTTIPQTLHFLSGYVDYSTEKGVDLLVVSSPGAELRRFAERHNVRAHAIPMRRAIAPLDDIVSIVRLCWFLHRTRPDIVHAHTPKAGFLGMVCSWLTGTNVRIYHVHGLRLETTVGYRRLIMRWSEVIACRLAHRVLCVSHSVSALMIGLKLCSPEKITVPMEGSISGVDADGIFDPARFSPAQRVVIRREFEIPDEAFVIGFVGRLAADKGVAELAEAWKTIRDAFPKARLVLAGQPDEADPVSRPVLSTLRADERVHWVGFSRDMPRLYSIMDLVVLPTYREGFGMVLLEAAAMDLPTVASRVTGCVDAVVDGVTGTLVAARDAVALANAVSAYLRSPSLRARHGRAGRERSLRDFRPQDVWEATFRAYDVP